MWGLGSQSQQPGGCELRLASHSLCCPGSEVRQRCVPACHLGELHEDEGMCAALRNLRTCGGDRHHRGRGSGQDPVELGVPQGASALPSSVLGPGLRAGPAKGPLFPPRQPPFSLCLGCHFNLPSEQLAWWLTSFSSPPRAPRCPVRGGGPGRGHGAAWDAVPPHRHRDLRHQSPQKRHRVVSGAPPARADGIGAAVRVMGCHTLPDDDDRRLGRVSQGHCVSFIWFSVQGSTM